MVQVEPRIREDDKLLKLERCRAMDPAEVHAHKNLLVCLASEYKIEMSQKGLDELTWDVHNYVAPRERFICSPRYTSVTYQGFMPPRFRPPVPVSAAGDIPMCVSAPVAPPCRALVDCAWTGASPGTWVFEPVWKCQS